ncbi:MAG: CRISPR-associated endoribonuclease Cas6, partial [Chloroflexi bacterium]|nr:CRISPR-associated endoribonuclease Cas6 [Chloroflexota bacterium]
MQIRIHLQGDPEPLRVPIHYNALLQGVLYSYLELHLAHFLHQEGWQDGKRRLRLFAFSRLLGKRRREGNMWVFEGPVTWYVASPW